ncbi:endothelin-converting enzyme homolog isoform X3 [Centruroides vittatus]|uniref:endothelin-converting enzyme homolog isoform X3 n=1 Tax=Centruroides vittatus TaxID=120091 RepID=UPI00350F2C08
MMSQYKRTDFEDEETSSTTSMQADALMVGSRNPKSPGGGMPKVNYQHHPRNLWQRATVLERLLMILVLMLILVIIILSAILDNKSSSHTIKVVHVTAYNHTTAKSAEEYCVTPACVTVASSILNAMDFSVDPCTDFYQYACGGWIKSNPLPDGKSLWGTFGKLWQENQLVMKNVLESNKSEFKSESERKARTYYFSCLDKNETIEQLGAKPMLNLLNQTGGWNISDSFDVQNWNFEEALQAMHNLFNRGGLFTWGVGEDERNSSNNIIQVDQGGLGLPTKDYYINKTEDDPVLNAYLTYMTKVGVLLGGEENATRRQMKEVIKFETKLAMITIPAEERRDDEQLYNKMTIAQLQVLAPVINWLKYFNFAFASVDRKLSAEEEVVVYAPQYLGNMSSLVIDYLSSVQGKIVLSNYLGWMLVQSLTSCLSKPFRDASKVLRKALIGSEGGEASWRYCVSDTNGIIGFALGAMFVREVFHGDSKIMAEQMIDEIREAFKKNLPKLSWMDPETTQLAREKANAITDMIGFPDFILNPEKLDKKYEGLEFNEDEYFDNNLRVSKFSLLQSMKKLRKPTNKTEWEMSPPTVNAYYTPTKNQIVFPAGILQAPFYDVNYPKSLNFGAMGVVMGHELIHAFDDQGREYDKDGNLHQWWKNSTIQSFQERIKCFIDQYSLYQYGGEQVKGKQTVGENIADNGGLKAAFNAYTDWVKENHVELPLPGVNLTHNQLFFIGFSQVWCSSSTPETMHLTILNDAHTPGPYRVIGTLSNSKDFAREFQCRLNTPMNPDKKCVIW